jgi:hypothetical protein
VAAVQYTFTHKQHIITQITTVIWKSAGHVQPLFYPGIYLTTEEKAHKNLSQRYADVELK